MKSKFRQASAHLAAVDALVTNLKVKKLPVDTTKTLEQIEVELNGAQKSLSEAQRFMGQALDIL